MFIGKYQGLENIGPSRLRKLDSGLGSVERDYKIESAADVPETQGVGTLVSQRFYELLSQKIGPVFTAQQARNYIEKLLEEEKKGVRNYAAPPATGGKQVKSARRETARRRPTGPTIADVSGFGQKYSSFEYLRPVEPENDHPPRTMLRYVISSQTPSRRESVVKIAEYLTAHKDNEWFSTFPMLLQAAYEGVGFEIEGFAVDTAPVAEYFSKTRIDIKAWFFKENLGKPSMVKMKSLAEKVEGYIREKYSDFLKKPDRRKRSAWDDLDDLSFGDTIPEV